ncbi:MAG: 2-C-methyl-D-erythritol 2,4-cyclodiphosphate synthase [Paenibacillaceae bacterium ZCTH02-B3]|nr:MAG: 2-C-methyl-D-erythritol 2,4-cyclodiphosphate synthase [Paenibacillaceae bacterium ZCTH02-B3]
MRWGAVIVAAGSGKRMGARENKVFLPLGGKPILAHALAAFEACAAVESVVVVAAPGERERAAAVCAEAGCRKVSAIVEGGAERQDSVRAGLDALDTDGVLVHDAARPLITPEKIEACRRAAEACGAAALAVPVHDTIKVTDGRGWIVATPDRRTLWAVQTPQAFRREELAEAHRLAVADGFRATDDAMLLERLGRRVAVVEGDYANVKITTPEDLELAERLLTRRGNGRGTGEDSVAMENVKEHDMPEAGAESTEEADKPFVRKPDAIRIGQGFDVHRLAEGRPCIIGGVRIPHDKGLLGHSDADVLLHAIADAILGALALGDIGRHFPDTDPAYAGADSMMLLARVWALARERGYRLGNVDATVIAQEPKMAPHIPAMRANIARVLECDTERVSVKATTSERLGFTGRGEGIAAQAVVCLVGDVL